jgi:glucose 1-dehydrogenase
VRLARAGHDVAISSRTGGTAAQRIGELVGAAGARFLSVTADVTQEADVERLFAETAERLGPVSGLVNNAGATLHIGDLADTPVAVVRQVLDVNLLGTVLCARQAAREMSTSRGGAGGAIVNVSSAAATLGSAHEYVHYAAAKAGVDALTVGLAKELGGQGIRVNAVAPGIIRTGIHADAGEPGRPDRLAGRVPTGRAGEVDEVTPAIAWLLGPEAAYVTGAVLRVAGGM